MITYKTKNTVTTDALYPSQKETAFASIDLISIDANAWLATGAYYTKDENGERVILRNLNKGFTAAEVTALEQQFGITSKSSPEAIQLLMVAAMPVILGQEAIFGLTSTDWQKV